MADKQDGVNGTDQSAMSDDSDQNASEKKTGEVKAAEGNNQPEMASKTKAKMSLRSLISKSKPSKNAPSTSKTKQSGLIRRLDQLVFFVLKAVLFGLIAAVVGTLAAFVIWQYRDSSPFGENGSAELAALREELSTMQELEATVVQNESQLGLLREGIQTIGGQIDELTTERDASNARFQELVARLAATEITLGELQNPMDMPSRNRQEEEWQELTKRIRALETVLFQENLAVGPRQQVALTGGIADRLTAIETGLEEIQTWQTEIEASGQQRSATDSNFESLESRLVELENWSRIGADPDRLLSRLGMVEAKVEELGAPNVEKFVLHGIRSAAEDGLPYSALIEDSEVAAADFPEVVHLYADTGIATMEDLRLELAGNARQILAMNSETSGGFFALLGNFFRIRPLTPQEGDDPAAVFSRAEEAMRRNNLAAALSELSQLPNMGQEAMADWIESAEARTAVLTAFDTMLKTVEENDR